MKTPDGRVPTGRVVTAMALIAIMLMGALNPVQSDDLLYGLAYSPYRTGQSPEIGIYPSRKEIAQDLEHLRPLTSRLRTYGLYRSGRLVVEEALKQGYRVLGGIWLGADPMANEQEIAVAIDIVKGRYPRLEGFIVGSEVLLRRELSPEKILTIIRRVRQETNMPVGYAEIAPIWYEGPAIMNKIAAASDFIVIHNFPYWEGASIDTAAAAYERALNRTRERFPAKRIIDGETGRPASGQTVGRAVASPRNQATWFRFILERSHRDRIFAFSAFSEEWKRKEGPAGAAWGIFKADGTLRPAIVKLLRERLRYEQPLSFKRYTSQRFN
tara:strand:+ start:565 stop:1545 length:981 start_codon:yes stop_codon:yes gene_type:complete